MKKKIIILLFSIIVITGCSTKERNQLNETSDSIGIVNKENIIYYCDSNYDLDIQYETSKIISNLEELNNLKETSKLSLNYDEEFFSNSFLYLIYLDNGSCKEYSITNIDNTGAITIEQPGNNCNISTDLSRRFIVIEIDNKYKNLNFSLNKITKDC